MRDQKPSSNGAKLADLHILLADNDAGMLRILKAQLINIGVRSVALAQSSEEAVRTLATQPFDVLIVSDALLPMDGVKLTRQLRARKDCPNQQTPVVLLAERAERSFIEMARDSGISEFIRRPTNGNILRQRLSAVMRDGRQFIAQNAYKGPDRRRRKIEPAQSAQERRKRSNV